MSGYGSGAGVRTCDAIAVDRDAFVTAIAFCLAEHRAASILLLRGPTIDSGTTGWMFGIVRARYTNQSEARLLTIEALVFYRRREGAGGECGSHRIEFLRVFGTADGEKLLHSIEVLRSLDPDVATLEPEELRGLQPYSSVEDIRAAAYEPAEGQVGETDMARAFSDAASERGVTAHQGVAVRMLRVKDNCSPGIDTSHGFGAAEQVVVAAGARSLAHLRQVVADLPLCTKLVVVGLLEHMSRMSAAGGTCITVIDAGTGAYSRRDLANCTEFALLHDWDAAPSTIRCRFLRRFWRNAPIILSDASQRSRRPSDVDGLYLTTATSETGLKVLLRACPCTLELHILGPKESVDLRSFCPTGFAAGVTMVSEINYTRPRWNNQVPSGSRPASIMMFAQLRAGEQRMGRRGGGQE